MAVDTLINTPWFPAKNEYWMKYTSKYMVKPYFPEYQGDKRICLQRIPKTPNTLHEFDLCCERFSQKTFIDFHATTFFFAQHQLGNFGKKVPRVNETMQANQKSWLSRSKPHFAKGQEIEIDSSECWLRAPLVLQNPLTPLELFPAFPIRFLSSTVRQCEVTHWNLERTPWSPCDHLSSRAWWQTILHRTFWSRPLLNQNASALLSVQVPFNPGAHRLFCRCKKQLTLSANQLIKTSHCHLTD